MERPVFRAGFAPAEDPSLFTAHCYRNPIHCLLDSELFLPEESSADRSRCRAAGIPEARVHRPKWQIALKLYDIAHRNGLAFSWGTFDEDNGGKPGFLHGLVARGPRLVGEVPRSLTGWIPCIQPKEFGDSGKKRNASPVPGHYGVPKRSEWTGASLMSIRERT